MECHYVSQFYLRRWAQNNGKEICVTDISTGLSTVYPTTEVRDGKQKPKKIPIGVADDLYTTLGGVNDDRVTVEAFLGLIENKTAECLKNLKNNRWEITPKKRKILAVFLAASILRHPVLLSEMAHDGALGGMQTTGEIANAALRAPLEEVASILYHNPNWTVVTYRHPQRQQTYDNPMSLANYEGTTPAEADPSTWCFNMPLDPYAILSINGHSGPNKILTPGVVAGFNPPNRAGNKSRYVIH